MTTPVVSIAYHSGYGHTAVLAEAVRDGAADAGATVHLIKVDGITEAEWELLDASDAIVFGSPTYMGTASGAFHQFAEDSSKRWFGDVWLDKLAAGFTNSGSKSGDKLHTLQYFQILAGQHGMHWVNLGLIFEPAEATADPEHFFDLESIEDPRELLSRATELTLAFRAATDRATEFQAIAAAQLADPRRFDRLTTADVAERAQWTEDYARKMIEFGRDLIRTNGRPAED